MFRYIRAMSIEKSKIITRMNTSSDTLMEHIVKVVVYNSQRQQDVNGWKKTCARILAKTGTYNAKKIRLTKNDYLYNQFGAFPSDRTDAKGVLEDTLDDLYKQGYPEIEYDSIPNLALNVYNVCEYIMENCLKVYTSKDKDKGYSYLRGIVDKAFEQIRL